MRVLDQARLRRVFGREQEIEEIGRMLASPGVVTVTGRGGVGKTSVAWEVVQALGPPERSVWVPLAGVTEPGIVPAEIAHALDAPIEAGSDAEDVVAEILGHGSQVLVLDNAEHLLAFAPALAALLERCPDLRVLVTSQAPLRLRSERVVALTPLPDPPDPADTMLEELAEQPAVATYCRRAAAVDPTFELSEKNARAVVELCRRLEGLPLAIELAAARAVMLPASEIVRRLDGAGFEVLHRPRGDAPERHHGLRAAIEWTYGLLTADEQRALRSLAVNVGTFGLDAAIELIGAPPNAEPAELAALDALSSLVDFHLVDPIPGADPPRFDIPDSIRELALCELDRHGERDEMSRRRVRSRARQAGVVADESEASGGETSMEHDRDDLLDALRTAIELGLADEALDIVRGLGSHWDLQGYGPVQEQLLERALELGVTADADPGRLANVRLWSAYLGLRHSSTLERDALVERIRSAEADADAVGDDATAFHAQSVWLLVTPTTGDVVQASRAVEKGLRLAERNGHDGWRATIQVWAGMLAQLAGDEQRAVELGTAAMEGARRRGDQHTVVRAYMLLGSLADRFPDQLTELPSAEEVIELTRTLGLGFYEALLVVRRAYQAVQSGDLDVAVRWMAEALDLARTLVGSPIVGFDLLALVHLAAARGDLDRAAFFSGAVRDSLPALESYLAESQRGEYRRTLDEVRERLGAAVFDRRVEQGSTLTRAEAVAEATGYIDDLQEPTEVDLTAPTPATELSLVDRLTARQNEVLRLLAAGMSNKEIAAELGVTAKTVMHHTTAIYRELGVRGRSEATAVAFRAGLAD